MNRGKLLIAAGVLSLSAAASGFAGDGLAVRAEVPFTFHAGKLVFPPGSYVFTVDNPNEPGLLTIQDRNGPEHELMLTVPEHRREGAAPETKLVFEQYGNDRFLAQIWVVGLDEGREVPKAEVERERAALSTKEVPLSVNGHVDR